MNYYLKLDGEIDGPYLGHDLRVMLVDRVISHESLILPAGRNDWLSLERWIGELQLDSDHAAQRELVELLPQAEAKAAPIIPDSATGSAGMVFLGVLLSLFAAALVYYAILW